MPKNHKKKVKIASTYDSCSSTSLSILHDQKKQDQYYLTDKDRITSIHETKDNIVVMVINVSYEIKINDKWITIVRFDSAHGYLHRHMRISLSDPDTTVENIGVIKKGTHKDWLPWARKYANRKYYDYKVGFCRRSKISIIDIW